MCLVEREKPSHSLKEAHMTSIADGSVIFQTSAESAPSTLSWFGEVTLIAAYLPQHGVLTKISERVCFARRRFGHYDVIDFLVVLFGYAISGERTLLRLDGLYGTGAVVADLADLSFVMRGKDYTVFDQPVVQSRLHLPADSHFSRPESTLVRALYDCPDVPVGPEGCRCRVVVATHPKGPMKSRVRLMRS